MANDNLAETKRGNLRLVGVVLLLITFGLNMVAQKVLKKYQMREI